MEILQYGFMQRAFVVGLLLAVITPCIGITIVLKRLSMVGDALSHSSLAGVALGLLLGINPVLGAGALCIVAAFGIEAIRKKIPRYSEMAIAIIMSAGIGLAGVLSGFVEDSANFNSFLFGSIVSISRGEMLAVCIISVAVLLVLGIFSRELFYIGFDENAARISGVPVRQVNFIFTILTAGSSGCMWDADGKELPHDAGVWSDRCSGHDNYRIIFILLCGSETGRNNRTARSTVVSRCSDREKSIYTIDRKLTKKFYHIMWENFFVLCGIMPKNI